jgi:uncharacterized protein
MLLNLVKAKNEEGVSQNLDVEFNLPAGLMSEKGCEILSPVQVKGSFKYQNEELFLDAKAEVKVSCLCDKCGERFEKTFSFDVREKFVEEYNIKTDDDYVINNLTVDLDKAVIDNFFESFPTKLLCKKTCKGLCSICGKNKNFFSCNCEQIAKEEQQQENPFSKLKNRR